MTFRPPPPAGANATGAILLGVALGVLVTLAHAGLRRFAPGAWEGLAAPPAQQEFDRLALLLVVLVTPVLEEVVFRGLVFCGLRRSLTFPWAAGLSALLFASCHPTGAAPAAFFLGVLTAFLAERTRTLFASTLAHVTYNALGLVASLWWLA